MTDFLHAIQSPADLRQIPRSDLPTVASELRACVLDNVSKTGGHLSSNLGTVELTLALHYVFNTPEDRIVWDVGHQTYPHKILTGRRERMPTLRQLNGLSGFPRRDESEYDTFGVGHSSTSISAALGMALAARQKGESRHSIAVIGDGAMTAGKDAAADKPTYVALMGLEPAQRLADQLAAQATQALQDTGLPPDRLVALRALCDMVVQRTH